MTLKIVTDSTCDLPDDLVASLGVTVVPCNVHFGDEVLRDGVDIGRAALYRRLVESPVHPKTSQPSVGTFVETYRNVAEGADEILSLHISSRLSATHHSATLAKEELQPAVPLEVVDTLQVSLGLGILVWEVARIANSGGTLVDAMDFLRREQTNVVSYVTVDTLEYLVRGGRASRLQGFFGALLDIKPVICVKDNGETHPVDRVRTRKRAMARLVEEVSSAKRVRAVGVLHAAAPVDAEAMATACAPYHARDEIILSEFSAVMGVHLGPRALGLGLWLGA